MSVWKGARVFSHFTSWRFPYSTLPSLVFVVILSVRHSATLLTSHLPTVHETILSNSSKYDAGWDYLNVSIAVGQFSCVIANPCNYDNIMTYGYYFPHYDRTKYIQCGIWDSAAQFSSCQELTCQPAGTVYDQTKGYCDSPANLGHRMLSLSCCFKHKVWLAVKW